MLSRTRSTTGIAFEQSWQYNQGLGGWLITGYEKVLNSDVCIDSAETYWRSKYYSPADQGGFLDIKSTTHLIKPVNVSQRIPYPPQYGWPDKLKVGSVYPTGMLYRTQDNIGFGTYDISEADLLVRGTTAVRRTLPTNPLVQFSTTLGEVRQEGLPSLVGAEAWQNRTKRAHQAGGEFLNVEFGWLPLVSDLKKFAQSVKAANALTRQYHKGSGDRIRRRYIFPRTVVNTSYLTGDSSVEAGNHPGPMSVNNTYLWTGALPPGSMSFLGQNETWFSGAFRYHIPLGNDLVSKMERWEADANKLLGLRLTPSMVYNLTPWTWAFDWMGNMGDVMSNISALGPDGLVMQYGYIMNRYQTRSDYSMVVPGSQHNVSGSATATHSVEYKHLRRRAATPYGFGFNMGSLSAVQDAVLVALALTHGTR